MSPQGTVVQLPDPVWQADVWYPYQDGADGTPTYPNWTATRIYRSTDPPTRPEVETMQAANAIGAGASAQLHLMNDRRSARIQANPPGGGPIYQSWKYPWYSPALNPASSFASGFKADAWSRVAIWDLYWRFQVATSQYPAGGSGFFFVTGHMASAFDWDILPAGTDPTRSLFGIEFVDDGSGGQTAAFSAWEPGPGTRTLHVLPSTFAAPAVWNTARIMVVSATGDAEAYLRAEINSEVLVEAQEFDSSTLWRPTDAFGSACTLFLSAALAANTDEWIQYRWRARFGTTDPEGVPL